MIFRLGKWIPALFEWGMPVAFVLALLDLLVNTCLNLCFGGYNSLKVHSFRDRSIGGKHNGG